MESENPDFIIFAGDVTDHGYATEYREAEIFINELKDIAETHIIPENHDTRNVGRLHFQKLIGDRKFMRIDKKRRI